jgi:hypothetical protein
MQAELMYKVPYPAIYTVVRSCRGVLLDRSPSRLQPNDFRQEIIRHHVSWVVLFSNSFKRLDAIKELAVSRFVLGTCEWWGEVLAPVKTTLKPIRETKGIQSISNEGQTKNKKKKKPPSRLT